jgi:AcrR family transcriptional regulator
MPDSAAPHRRRRSAQAQDDFRREILDLARRVYREQGYEALSIRAVTEPLGVSQMAFYAYFPSKADLVRHIWLDMLEEQLAELRAAGQGAATPADALHAHAEAFLAFWERRPDQYRLFMTQLNEPRLGGEWTLVDEPVYRALIRLHHDRVAACVAAPAALPAGWVDQQAELAYLKAVGYLHTTLGLGRYPFADLGRLREAVLQDIVGTVLAALRASA